MRLLSPAQSALMALLAGLTLAGCAEFKEAGRTVGHTTRNVTREIGHTTRDVTREIGHASRDAAKEVGHSTEQAVKEVGDEISD